MSQEIDVLAFRACHIINVIYVDKYFFNDDRTSQTLYRPIDKYYASLK